MRKLAWISLACSAAVFLSYYILPLAVLPAAALCCAALSVLCFFRRKRSDTLFRAFLCFLGAALGLTAFVLHWNRTTGYAVGLDGEELTVPARVMEYPDEAEHYTRLHLRMTGKPKLDMLLYDYDGNADDSLSPGDLVQVTARFRRADLRNGERSDNYVSKDIYLTGTLLKIQSTGERHHTLRSLAAFCSGRISTYADSVFSDRTSIFMRSLMLGDKTDFYRDLPLYADMRGAGFMHVVAVSGMHIAFLVGMIQLLFGARPAASVTGILVVWFFVFMTGASPSAVRAGIMQTVLLTAPIVRRENDGPTSLSFALALILMTNPFSCASISLQLSFSAMAGMILLAEPITDFLLKTFRQEETGRLRAPLSVVGASLAVLVTSTPFSVLHFGTLALYSPLTNLLGLWAVSLCFCGGWLSCLLSLAWPPLGMVFVFLTELLAKYLIGLTGLISDLPHNLIGMGNAQMLLWLALCYVLGFLAWRSREKNSVRLFVPLLLCILTLTAALTAARQRYRSGSAVIAAMDVGQGECVCVLSGDKTVMLDCGGIGSLSNAGDTAACWLESAGRDRVDLLILSHLHEDHVNGVPMLLELIPVKTILFSQDADSDEGLQDEILHSAERHGTEVLFVHEDGDLACGNIRIRLFAPGTEGSENERCIISLVSVGEFDMLFTGDSLKKAERDLVEQHDLPDTELLIVGHHGSRTSSDGDFLSAIHAEEAIISVGRNNSFGHPTWEVLERLNAYGYHISRTDLNGTVEVRVR